MLNVQCSVFSVQCSVCSVQSALRRVDCAIPVFNVQSTRSLQYAVFSKQCSVLVCSVQFTLCIIQCTIVNESCINKGYTKGMQSHMTAKKLAVITGSKLFK